MKTARQPLAVTTALSPYLAKDSRYRRIFCLSSISVILLWVEKTGVGLCAAEKEGWLSTRDGRFPCVLKGQLVDDPRSWYRRRYSLGH